MIVKPSISFLTHDGDPQLITDTNTILTDMTGNPSYPAPIPALATIKPALDEFSTAYANAAGGGVTLTSIKNDKRAALAALLRQLASYVQVACNGDLTVLLSSGFPIQKPQRNPVGVLPAPAYLTVAFGARTGELDAGVVPVPGAAIYNWQLAAASAPTAVLQTAQTTAASNSFAGLTPGVTYVVQVNAVGSAGPSDWSEPVSQMAV
ncbi:MAG TPA: fibronectin type III domain-containing protein [Verrucomicrobiae bacterium]